MPIFQGTGQNRPVWTARSPLDAIDHPLVIGKLRFFPQTLQGNVIADRFRIERRLVPRKLPFHRLDLVGCLLDDPSPAHRVLDTFRLCLSERPFACLYDVRPVRQLALWSHRGPARRRCPFRNVHWQGHPPLVGLHDQMVSPLTRPVSTRDCILWHILRHRPLDFRT